jgi:hypothetical protein
VVQSNWIQISKFIGNIIRQLPTQATWSQGDPYQNHPDVCFRHAHIRRNFVHIILCLGPKHKPAYAFGSVYTDQPGNYLILDIL